MAEFIKNQFQKRSRQGSGTREAGQDLVRDLQSPRLRKQLDGLRKTELFREHLDRVIDFNIDEHGCVTGNLLWPNPDDKELLLDVYVGNDSRAFMIDAKSGNTVVFDAAFKPGTTGRAELLAARQNWVVDAVPKIPSNSAEMQAMQQHLLSRKDEFAHKAKVAAACGKEYVVLVASPALAKWAWANLDLPKNGPQARIQSAPLGGSYAEIKRNAISNNRIEVHHAPSDEISNPFPRSHGSAIAMYREDHKFTLSYKANYAVYKKQFRAGVEASPDGVRKVYEVDKKNILSINPVYAGAVRQMDAYFEQENLAERIHQAAKQLAQNPQFQQFAFAADGKPISTDDNTRVVLTGLTAMNQARIDQGRDSFSYQGITIKPSPEGDRLLVDRGDQPWMDLDYRHGCLSCTGPLTLDEKELFESITQDYRQGQTLDSMDEFKVHDTIHELPESVEMIKLVAQEAAASARGVPGLKIAHLDNFMIRQDTDAQTLCVFPPNGDRPLFSLDLKTDKVSTNASDQELDAAAAQMGAAFLSQEAAQQVQQAQNAQLELAADG